jgi:hypothetical protein
MQSPFRTDPNIREIIAEESFELRGTLTRLCLCVCAALVMLSIISTPARGDDTIQAVSSADGRLEIFVSGSSTTSWSIHHIWQTSVGGASPQYWAAEPGDFYMRGVDFIAGRDSQGKIFEGTILQGAIYFQTSVQVGGPILPTGHPLDTHDLHGLRLAADADGRLELFALSSKGVAWSTAETATGNRQFANHFLDGTKLKSVAPASFGDGRLALVAIGGDDGVWWESQTAPNANWGGWTSLAGHDIQAIAAGANADGRLEVLALGKNKTLYHRYQLVGGGWSEWNALGAGPFFEPMSVAKNADGRLEVFINNGTQQIVHAWQTSPNGPWTTAFAALDVVPSNIRAHSVTLMPDGRLVIAAVGDGAPEAYANIHIAGQVVPNGDWQSWPSVQFPPTPSKPPTPPKPDITKFEADHNNGYAPIGTTFTFSWNVLQCGSDCKVSLTGKTGLGSYNQIFYFSNNLPPQGQTSVKPTDTNTQFTLDAQNGGGSSSKNMTVTLTGTPPPDPCPTCKLFYFKMTPSSNLLPCAKKSYMAPDEDTAKKWAGAEFPGYTVATITEAQFMSSGC